MPAQTVYQDLDENEIRLLKISPGTRDDSLVCSLHRHNLTTGDQPYLAISYAWGPPEDPRYECQVDGVSFTIRQNAYNILTALRKPDQDVYVWLDALCIQQENKNEKSIQIRLMYTVYKKSARTVIWLGIADEHTASILEYAESLDLDVLSKENRIQTRFNQHEKSFILKELAAHPRRNQLVNGIAEMFRAVWFSRVWIRQEGAVGRDPYALRGRFIFSWSQLVSLAYLFEPPYAVDWPDWVDFNFGDIERTLQTIAGIERYRVHERNETLSRTANPLFQTVSQARGSSTEKPHDKIYALSTMASDAFRTANELFVKPNYHLSWQEIYVNANQFFMSDYAVAFEVLEQAGLMYHGATSDLPTWVPDWRYPAPPMFLPLSNWTAGGDRGHVRAKVTPLSKKERARICAYQGPCSIAPLCRPLNRDKQDLERQKAILEEHRSEMDEEQLKLAQANIQGQEKHLRTLESASRAALVLDIQASMQDTIIYVSAATPWAFEHELPNVYQSVIACDNANLTFLESLKKEEYITSEPLRQAYNATLISSQDAENQLASPELISSAESWRAWLASGPDMSYKPAFHLAIETSFMFRDCNFAYTASGYMALVPSATRVGDEVVVFPGYQSPFVIRPVMEWYMLLGMCYVHGMMRSDASTLIEEFNIKWENGRSVVKRPQGDVRANGLKLEAGRYVEVLGTLGKRWIKLI